MVLLESDSNAADECLDWRSCERNKAENRHSIHGDYDDKKMKNYYNKIEGFKRNKRRVVIDTDGKKMKYCPGNRCKLFLPLFQFSYNYNMIDGMDTYCVECNQVKRHEKKEQRRKTQGNTYSIDKFEEFRLKEQYNTPYGFTDIPVLKRDVIRKIDEIFDDFKNENPRLKLPFTSQVIYDKLFNGRRLICTKTGNPLSPSCFMEHHGLSIVINDDGERLDVKCNKVKIP